MIDGITDYRNENLSDRSSKMMLMWKIRYLHRLERRFADRMLVLNTQSLEPATKAAIEFLVETKGHRSGREVLKFRSLFREKSDESVGESAPLIGKFDCFGLTDYFEDENGAEISIQEIGALLSGNPDAISIPRGAQKHNVELILSEPRPMPLAEVVLSNNDLKVLGYFCRDLRELASSAFMEDGPGTLKSGGGIPVGESVLETAANDEEIRSFVIIFRRLYMENEPAGFLKAVEVFGRALGGHPRGKWITSADESYRASLDSVPDFRPFVTKGKCTFARKRLIDVFLYTQYAHQPDARRQNQFKKCLQEVGGNKSLLMWMFLTEIWKSTLEIGNAGRIIVSWFGRYCQHHQLSADVIESVLHENPGIGTVEKEAVKRSRVLGQKASELADELWRHRGSPTGGAIQFLHEAHERLTQVMSNGVSIEPRSVKH